MRVCALVSNAELIHGTKKYLHIGSIFPAIPAFLLHQYLYSAVSVASPFLPLPNLIPSSQSVSQSDKTSFNKPANLPTRLIL